MTVLVTKKLRKVHKYDLAVKPPKKQTQYMAFKQKETWYKDGIFAKSHRIAIVHDIFAKILRISKGRTGNPSMYYLRIISDITTPQMPDGPIYKGERRYRPWALTEMKAVTYDANKLPLKYFTQALGCSIRI